MITCVVGHVFCSYAYLYNITIYHHRKKYDTCNWTFLLNAFIAVILLVMDAHLMKGLKIQKV